MKKRTYGVLVAAVVALCVLLTAAHVSYVLWAYPNSSVIHFIAREPW